MHVRIVRFTDVTSQRMDELKSRLEESDAPPPDSHVKAVRVFVDQEQGTAVVFQDSKPLRTWLRARSSSAPWIRATHPAPARRSTVASWRPSGTCSGHALTARR